MESVELRQSLAPTHPPKARQLYAYLPHAMDWTPFTRHHVGETVQILAFTFIAFWLLRPKLAGEPLLPVDADWAYRKPLKRAGARLVTLVNATFDACGRSAVRFAFAVQGVLANPIAAVRGADRKTYDADEHRPTIGVTAVLALAVAGAIALWIAS